MLKFETGKTYLVRSLGDYDCVFSFTVVKRTEKTIWLESDMFNGEVKSKRVKVIDGQETVMPLGRYSLAPMLTPNLIAEPKQEERDDRPVLSYIKAKTNSNGDCTRQDLEKALPWVDTGYLLELELLGKIKQVTCNSWVFVEPKQVEEATKETNQDNDYSQQLDQLLDFVENDNEIEENSNSGKIILRNQQVLNSTELPMTTVVYDESPRFESEEDTTEELDSLCYHTINELIRVSGFSADDVYSALEAIIDDRKADKVAKQIAKETIEQPLESNIEEILIHWSEASYSQNQSFATVQDAMAEMRSWYESEADLPTRGYHKTKVSLYFNDGSEHYTLRIDIDKENENIFATDNIFKDHLQAHYDWLMDNEDKPYIRHKTCGQMAEGIRHYLTKVVW